MTVPLVPFQVNACISIWCSYNMQLGQSVNLGVNPRNFQTTRLEIIRTFLFLIYSQVAQGSVVLCLEHLLVRKHSLVFGNNFVGWNKFEFSRLCRLFSFPVQIHVAKKTQELSLYSFYRKESVSTWLQKERSRRWYPLLPTSSSLKGLYFSAHAQRVGWMLTATVI